MEQTQKTWLLCRIIVVGLVVALIYHGFIGLVLGRSYPADTFLFSPALRFSDFYWIFEPVQAGSPYSGKWSLYAPAAYLPLFPLARLSWPVAYFIVAAVFVGSVLWFFWHRLDFLPSLQRAVASFCIPISSVGVLFVLDRGNLDMLVLVFVMVFLSLFQRGKYIWSALPLAAAIASKIYPGALGVLLLMRRQYAAAALAAVLTVVMTVGAMIVYPGGITGTIDLMRDRLAFMDSMYIYNPTHHWVSVNYMSLVKIACRVLRVDFVAHADAILLGYNIMSVALFVVVAGFVLLRERILWKQVYLLMFLTIVIPPMSQDYKLIFVLAPVALFLAHPAARRRDDLFYIITLGIILIPKAYVPLSSETRIGGLINPLALTLIAAHMIWSGLVRRDADLPGERITAEPRAA